MGGVNRPRDWSVRAHITGRFRLRGHGPWMPAEAWQYNSVVEVCRFFHMRIDFAGVVPMVGCDIYLRGKVPPSTSPGSCTLTGHSCGNWPITRAHRLAGQRDPMVEQALIWIFLGVAQAFWSERGWKHPKPMPPVTRYTRTEAGVHMSERRPRAPIGSKAATIEGTLACDS